MPSCSSNCPCLIVTPLTHGIVPVPVNYKSSSTEPTFYEAQRFRQIWVWILLAVIAVLAWYILALQLPSLDPISVIVVAIFGIVFPVWFYVTKLEVRVDETLLSYRMYPLQVRWKDLPFKEIESARSVTYRPVLDYTGWGIRFGPKGWAYNAYGNKGVCIMRKNGKRFLLGSQRSEKLAMALQSKIGL
jgi:hypothetical protein